MLILLSIFCWNPAMFLDANKDLSEISMHVECVTAGVSDDRKPAPEHTMLAADDDIPSDGKLKDFEATIQKFNPIGHIPTPNRRRSASSLADSAVDSSSQSGVDLAVPQAQQSQCGPTPWDEPKSTKSSQQEGGSYRDQLRVSGQQALQRARDHGLVPKASGSSSGASTPSSSAAPLPLSIFGALNTQPTSSDSGAQFRGNSQPQPQPQQHVQYQMQPAFFQPQVFFQPQQTCFQPQQAFFVTQVPPMMGFQTSGSMMSAQVQSQLPCREQRQVANSTPSPATGFYLNSEQMAEMLKRAEEDIYED